MLQLTAALGLAAAGARSAEPAASKGPSTPSPDSVSPLTPPADGRIPVAFVLSQGAQVIDFAGPWEVFDSVHVPGPRPHPFDLYMVAETTAPIHATGGMTLVPNYTIANAPPPKVIVIPAQAEPSEALVRWIRTAAASTDLTISICTGAFALAKTGLLSGKTATTHHGAYAELAATYPNITVKRGARFVDLGNIASSGGLTSGMDLALHVVDRYFGRQVALRTADGLEYQGLGWLNADSNAAYAKRRVSTDAHPLCPVCEMDIVDIATAPRSTYHGRTYYFCMEGHKSLFDAAPDRVLAN
jgi:transcriptional regulator GlxA family with amidase domain/YHS domain-containing protein